MQRFGQKLRLINQETDQRESNRADSSKETELVRRCMRGDRAAQQKMYNSLAPKMFVMCIRYMGSRDEAEDVLQDGFVTLFSKLGTYTGEGSFEGWARKIFVNTALMALRKKDTLRGSEQLETAYGLDNPSADQVRNLGYKELLGLVAGLPAGYRTIFNMAVIEGYSHKEIAEALGISEGTSRSQLQRARTLLQEKIRRTK